MAEEKTTFNPDFLVDPKKHKKLLSFAREIFSDPSKISKADIAELSPENPALASKVLLSAYTRALKEEARKLNTPNKEDVLETISTEYALFLENFLEKNKSVLKTLNSTTQKGGN